MDLAIAGAFIGLFLGINLALALRGWIEYGYDGRRRRLGVQPLRSKRSEGAVGVATAFLNSIRNTPVRGVCAQTQFPRHSE